jgi:hypothetical protein
VARVVALAGPLDLDHFGAQVGEQLRAPRAGEHAGEVEDADAREDRIHRKVMEEKAFRRSAPPFTSRYNR